MHSDKELDALEGIDILHDDILDRLETITLGLPRSFNNQCDELESLIYKLHKLAAEAIRKTLKENENDYSRI